MTKLYLVRHGETVDNVNQILQGQTQGDLNENGREQAKELARKMASVAIDLFVSSDLKRAVETCEIIASAHGLPVMTTSLLRERDWGDFTGEYIPNLKDKVWPANVESLEHLKDRARRFLDYVRNEFHGQTVLAVGHGIINKAIQSVYNDLPMNEILKMGNAEVRELEL
ncbi:histidine phosphatase family protein, partial [Bacteroides heparinolyticus]|uniref:histidine phosphatase family protein n=1 Tax=Prevotella heparinolytica TaxID=28113 RepID=UPI0035A04834